MSKLEPSAKMGRLHNTLEGEQVPITTASNIKYMQKDAKQIKIKKLPIQNFILPPLQWCPQNMDKIAHLNKKNKLIPLPHQARKIK